MRLEVKRLPAGKSGATRPIELAPILRKSRGGVRVRVIKVRVRVRVRLQVDCIATVELVVCRGG